MKKQNTILPRFIELDKLVDVLITTLDARDPYTYSHSWRVAELSTMIAKNMNFSKEKIDIIHLAARLHDIGKIGVPDRLLTKPGKLTKRETFFFQTHPVIGYNIARRIKIFKDISKFILYHHERFDGLGYPEGVKGKNIPLDSRIMAVADTFDAITSNRPYRKRTSMKKAFYEINKHSGNQFDPLIVQHFNEIFDSIPKTIKKVEREKIIHYAHAEHKKTSHSLRVKL